MRRLLVILFIVCSVSMPAYSFSLVNLFPPNLVSLIQSFFDQNPPVFNTYISLIDPQQLNAVRVNFTVYIGSVSKTEVDFGDGTVIQNQRDVTHLYNADGSYTIKVRVWNSKNLVSEFSQTVQIQKNIQYFEKQVIFGPVNPQKNKLFIFSVPVAQVKKLYKISLQTTSNSNLSVNMANALDPSVLINNVSFFTKSEVATQNTKIEKLVTLQSSNLIEFKDALPISLKIIEMAPQFDVESPLVTANISANSLVRQNQFHVQVSDASATTTFVWNSKSSLILSTTSKDFDVALEEGLNDFTIQSIDQYGNKSQPIYLWHVQRDTVPAVISTNLVPSSIYSSYPQIFTLHISTNEDVQSLTVNGVAAMLVAPREFEYLVTVNSPGAFAFHFEAIDLAGNRTIFDQVHTFLIDNVPPAISLSLASYAVTTNNRLHVSVVDAAHVTTEIYRAGQLEKSTTEKEFDLQLNEGLNDFKIISKDEYGNFALPVDVVGVQLDTFPPVILSQVDSSLYFQKIPAQYQIYFTTNEKTKYLEVNGEKATTSDGQHYQFNFQVTQVGLYVLNVVTEDLAGNMTSRQLQITSFLDNQSPEITLPLGPLYTMSSSVLVPVTVSDISSTITEIYIDHQYLASVSEKNFSYLIDLSADGEHLISLKSVDQAGNRSEKSLTVVRDARLLSVQIESPQPGAIYTSQAVEVRLTANKLLRKVKVNHLEVALNSDLKSLRYFTQVQSAGPFAINIEIEDFYGAQKSFVINAEMQPNGLASWTYEECSATEPL